MTEENPESKKKYFITGLIKWFGDNSRSFPWRKTENPYELLVAEILLQRTRAENVVPVYEKFLNKYPSIGELRDSDADEMEETISALGLQEPRAERLKKISERVVEEYDGVIPLSKAQLLSFKGVGPYIARAVLCFSGKDDLGVVDKNVARIVGRYFDYEMKSSPCSDKELIKFVQSMVPLGEAKKFNWSMLDFGALVCRARKPKCPDCVLKERCSFFK